MAPINHLAFIFIFFLKTLFAAPSSIVQRYDAETCKEVYFGIATEYRLALPFQQFDDCSKSPDRQRSYIQSSLLHIEQKLKHVWCVLQMRYLQNPEKYFGVAGDLITPKAPQMRVVQDISADELLCLRINNGLGLLFDDCAVYDIMEYPCTVALLGHFQKISLEHKKSLVIRKFQKPTLSSTGYEHLYLTMRGVEVFQTPETVEYRCSSSKAFSLSKSTVAGKLTALNCDGVKISPAYLGTAEGRAHFRVDIRTLGGTKVQADYVSIELNPAVSRVNTRFDRFLHSVEAEIIVGRKNFSILAPNANDSHVKRVDYDFS